MDSDFEWFVRNYDNLFKEYGTCYLVIKDEQVWGAYDNRRLAIERAWQEHEPGTVSIHYCNGKESGYTTYIYSSWEIN